MNEMDINFTSALDAWLSGADLRRRRERYKSYTYGRQWVDTVRNSKGELVSEKEYIESSGGRPMVNNVIRQLVKCVVGNFRSRLSDETPSRIDMATIRRNSLDELDCRMLEEFLISGCAIQRIVTENRPRGAGVWIDNVSPSRFFINRFSDPRGLDIEILGQLHDMSLRELQMRFAGRQGHTVKDLQRIYGTDCPESALKIPIGDPETASFFRSESGRCRVIEVWTLESRNMLRCHDPRCAALFDVRLRYLPKIQAVNAARAQGAGERINVGRYTSMCWHCRFFAPTGELLDEYDSPYAHGLHPYVLKFYPLTDGEVHSFVEDICEQQRNINRLITLIDRVISVSAKGVLLFPVDQKPDGMTWEDLGEMWAESGSIVPYVSRSGAKPEQVVSSGEATGAYHLLNLQMSLLQQISGVAPALQGQIQTGNTSAALYDTQLHNAAMSIFDMLEAFNAFRSERTERVLTI